MSQSPWQLPTQMPSHAAAASSSHAPTQEPMQSVQPIEQSLPAGPVLPPSAVPPVDELEGVLVLLAPGPSLVPSLAPDSVAGVVDASELESSLASSPQAAAINKPASIGMAERGIVRRGTAWRLEPQAPFWVTDVNVRATAAWSPSPPRA